ncbi:MAG: hypothetical protein ABJO09_14690 [Hyphomicrobiales bacterium]
MADVFIPSDTMKLNSVKWQVEDVKAERVDTVVIYIAYSLIRARPDFTRIFDGFLQNRASFENLAQRFNAMSPKGGYG